MRLKFLVFFLVLLVACAAPPPTSTPTPTLSPTATSTPTATPTLTPTPIPTPLPHPAAFDEAFARGLIRYENGQWLVSVVRTADGGRQTVELILLPDTFDTHDDLRLKNPLAPYTVRALDEDGQPVTLIWNPEKAEFRLAYTFPALFAGVGSENPRLIAENLEKIPFIPIEDIQSGLAAQSVLLAMQESGYQPFSENTRLGENRLHFELRNNGLKTAELLSLANLDLKLDVNHHPIKVTPFLFKSQLNGQDVLVSSIAILNPADHENWSPDEFIVTFGINYPEIETQSFTKFFKKGSHFLINSLYLYATNPNLDPNDPNTIVIPNPNNPDNPTLLDARDPFQSLLAQLLSIEGNDATEINGYEYSDTVINVSLAITHYSSLLKTEGYGDVIEMPIPPNLILPPELQQMIFLFEVGVAQ